MSKFKVGDEVAIAAVVKITGIQNCATGAVTYQTDRGFCIHEVLMDEIALSAKPTDRLMGREEPSACKYEKLSPSGRCMVGEGVLGLAPSYQCIGEKCKAHRDYKEPAPQPAPRFKVGDRVATTLGNGTVLMTAEMSGNGDYLVAIDNYKSGHSGRPWSERIGVDCARGDCMWFNEKTLSPAPEPKYYTGKVVCTGYYYGYEWAFRDVVGRILIIENGKCINQNLMGQHIESFAQLCSILNKATWMEVKD